MRWKNLVDCFLGHFFNGFLERFSSGFSLLGDFWLAFG